MILLSLAAPTFSNGAWSHIELMLSISYLFRDTKFVNSGSTATTKDITVRSLCTTIVRTYAHEHTHARHMIHTHVYTPWYTHACTMTRRHTDTMTQTRRHADE